MSSAQEAVQGLLAHFGMVDAATWQSVAHIIESDLDVKGVKAEVVGIRNGVVSVACSRAEVMLVHYDTERLGALVAKKHPDIHKIIVVEQVAVAS